MSHLEIRLEKDLNTIRDLIVEQAERVAVAVDESIEAVQTGDVRQAYSTVLKDHAVNRQMREIDRLCHAFIAIHLPSAGPLRLLSSIIRANVELERIGDYAVIISREVVQMSKPPEGQMGRELERVSSLTSLMLNQSVKAFRELNAELARGTKAMADQLEYNMDTVYDELMNNTEKAQIKDLLATFVIFNQIKRVSDLSKNLCEHTIFAATGEQKSDKVYNVLFVDQDGCCLAPLAKTIARTNYPDGGRFSSAAYDPTDAIDSRVQEFIKSRGLPDELEIARSFNSIPRHELSEQHVVVCLQVGMEPCLEVVPFHTSIVEWKIEQSDDPENLYRELAPQIKDLMELLRGYEVA